MKHLTARQWEVLQQLDEQWRVLDRNDAIVASTLTHAPRVGKDRELRLVEVTEAIVEERFRKMYRLTANGRARVRWEQERRGGG